MEVKSKEHRRSETFEEMFARVMGEIFLEESQVVSASIPAVVESLTGPHGGAS